MSRAVLRIDDSPSQITPEFMDYLCARKIRPLVFATGENLKKHFDKALYALEKGAIFGNHSFSHKHFSEMSFDDCKREINNCEELLDRLYEKSGVERKYKIFAFPYGDKGGENKELLQGFLKENGFCRIDDRDVSFGWYKENHLDRDIDCFWTFDFGEYMLRSGEGFTYQSILGRIHDENPRNGGALLEKESFHIVLIHDHAETNKFMPEYYKEILDYVLECGVEFVSPQFIV